VTVEVSAANGSAEAEAVAPTQPPAPKVVARLFGEPRLAGPLGTVPIAGAPGLLLALLAARGQRPIAPAELADELWDEDPPRTADAALRVHLTKVRGWLRRVGAPEALERVGGGILLVGVTTDVRRFEQLAAAAERSGRAGDHATALATWVGQPFAGLPANQVLDRYAQRLHRLRSASVVAWAEALPLSDADRHLGDVLRLVDELPELDRLAAAAVRHLAAVGDRTRALALVHGHRERSSARGLSLPVPIEEAEREVLAGPRTGVRRQRPAMVGRAVDEVGVLRVLDRVAEGAVVVVSGEAGIGKSTLATWAAEQAAGRGWRVSQVRLEEGPPAVPFEVLLDTLDALDVAEFASGATGPVAGSLGGAELSDQRTWYRAVERALSAAAAEEPVLCVFDDLHLADPSTVALLQHLVRRRPRRVVLLLTFRTPDVGASGHAAAWRAELAVRSDVVTLHLGGIDDASVATLLPELADRDVRELVRVTGGNPFFLRQLADLLLADGSRPDWGRVLGGGVPAVSGVLGRRLDQLTAHTAELVGHIAVHRSGVPVELLVELCDAAPAACDRALREAIDQGVLVRRVDGGDETIDVVHALFRAEIERRLAPVERQTMHRRFAAVLERRLEHGEHWWACDLALHLAGSGRRGDRLAALTLTERAAAESLQRAAYDTAAAQYGRALELADLVGAEGVVRARLHLGRADAHRRRGDPTARRDEARRASNLAREAGDVELAVDAALAHASMPSIHGVGDSDALAVLEEATSLWRLAHGAGGDPCRAARLLARSGQECHLLGELDRADQFTRDAVTAAATCGDPVSLAIALDARIWSLHRPDAFARRLAAIQHLHDVASLSGAREWVLAARLWRAAAWFEAGALDELAADLPELVRLADDLDVVVHSVRVLLVQAALAIHVGDHDLGLDLVHRAHARGVLHDARAADRCRSIQLLPLLMAQNLPGSAASLVAPLAERQPEAALWAGLAAWTHAAAGDADSAQVHLGRLRRTGLRRVPVDHAWLPTIVATCRGAELVGDAELGAVCRVLLAPHAGRSVTLLDLAELGTVPASAVAAVGSSPARRSA
jgi:DNA-binding SARP family transcriptional activator